MTNLRIGSLCSGYGGLDMAVMDVLDASVAWHAQYDPDDAHQYAARILAHRWPAVPNHGDITSIDWAAVEPVDILTAGFPCQPVSNAGKRKGKADERWLWPHVEAAIRRIRPRFVFLENVSALANRGGDAVLGALAALGFDAEWTCLRASDVGAPHRRDRWFCLAWDTHDVLGHRAGQPVVPAESDPVGDAGGPAPDPEGVGEREPADQADAVAGGRDAREEPGRRGVRAAPDADGVRLGPVERHLRQGQPDIEGRAPADAASLGRGKGRPEPARERGRPDAAQCGGTDWGPYEPAIARWEHVMGRCAPAPTEPGKNGPRLAARFVEWLMGCPEGHITAVPGIPRTAQLKAAGNGVVRQQGAAALRLLLDRAPAWVTERLVLAA